MDYQIRFILGKMYKRGKSFISFHSDSTVPETEIMRFLLLVLLFGLAAALPRSGFYRDEGEGEDIKTELGKKLKEHLEDILAKIKDAIDHGRDVKDDLIEKAKEIREKLKELHIEIKGKLKEMLEKAKNRLREWFKKLWEKDEDGVSRRDLREKFNDFICRLKDKLQQRLDEGKIRQFIEDRVPEGGLRDRLIKYLEHGRTHLKRIVDFLADKCGDSDDDDEVSRRSIADKFKEVVRKLKQMLQDAVDKQTMRQFIEDHMPAGKIRDILLRNLDKGREQLQKLLDLMDRGD